MRWLFDPWLILGAVGFGIGLACAILMLLWVTRSPQAPAGDPPAVLTVIPYPTATATQPTTTPTPFNQTTPESKIPPPPPAGDISVGAYVEISGTGGEGLRLRAEPGLNGEVRMVGLEAEVFQVRDGPQEADGYAWWYLVAPFDENRNGWGVVNYLAVVQNP